MLPTRIEGPADLVVEVLSPDSVARDRGVKLRDYAAAGVQEYWLLDPEAERIEVYGRQPDGAFIPLVPNRTGALASQVVPGLRLRPEWLWPGAGQPPDVLAALRAHGIG